MSKAKSQSNLLGLVEDSDDELETGLAAKKSLAKESTKMPAAKKPTAKGRAAANRVTKPAQSSSSGRRASGRIAAAVQTAAERNALAEKSSNERVAPTGRGRKAAAKNASADEVGGLATPPNDETTKPRPRGRPKTTKPAEADAMKEVPDSVSKPAAVPVAKRGRKPAKKIEEEPEEVEIPETQQPDVMDLDVEEASEVEELPTYQKRAPASVQRALYQVPFSASRRPPIAPDIESDVSLRRRLGEMSKKYDSLELKYRDLREIAVKEAEMNFDRLKKQGEEKTKVSNQLIASLKSEVASQKELAKEGQRFKKQLEASEAKVDNLQANITELTKALSEAKAETKSLATKLAAVRTGDPKMPSSAMKNSNMGPRGNNDSFPASQTAQMKENLYGDLTGLIIRGVRREGGEGGDDVFDCIQTGRNGALHFKLAVADESSENYDEAEFMYMPQMDPSRDKALMDMLPDFLIEEITFPRLHAAKFYSRLMKSLTERQE
ncbi:Monopolin complex subunit pcs1 [Pleurostoma richardsiae]|uniref:Monopolin complex subunit pcs1 n=1 Tax=Pleurostoma richardsiae TaxID=41990 RepID=A0AA38S232_9PEZI|nr:Monopolin complex subunit pcs1 [Pleurostoma richardsiae]